MRPKLRLLWASARLNPDVITRNSPLAEVAVSQSRRAAPGKGKQPRPRSIFPGTGAVHFSTRGEYGVRLIVELARHHGAGPISLAEIADHEELPRPYLEQLVVSLREAGLVHSTRGARGGYQLSRPPQEIRMGEVLRALEGPIAPMICASEDPAHAGICGRTGFCNVNHLWLTVQKAISGALDSITLADLAVPRPSHPYHSLATLSTRTHATDGVMTQTLERAQRPTRPRPQSADDRTLVIRDLHVVPVADRSREILRGINLEVRQGEVHAIMGRNGSGKTTLAYALMGHPAYEVTAGEVLWKGHDLLKLSPDKRSRLGIFLAFQYPTAIPGLSVASFLRTALNARMRPLDRATTPTTTRPT